MYLQPRLRMTTQAPTHRAVSARRRKSKYFYNYIFLIPLRTSASSIPAVVMAGSTPKPQAQAKPVEQPNLLDFDFTTPAAQPVQPAGNDWGSFSAAPAQGNGKLAFFI